jgi:hypothetical protein
VPGITTTCPGRSPSGSHGVQDDRHHEPLMHLMPFCQTGRKDSEILAVWCGCMDKFHTEEVITLTVIVIFSVSININFFINF